MKSFYFYFSDKSLLNEVTTVYVKTLEDVIKDLGFKVIYTYNYKSIPKKSKILTITDKCNFTVLSKCNPEICINWFQGIVPEEAALTFENKLSKYPRVWYHNFLERYTLKRNDLNIFVSNSMQEHYKHKYGLKIDNGFIMPCFNCTLDKNVFTTNRYRTPSFVYAGSLAKWQCVEPMIKAFVRLKHFLPNAKLAIFTHQKEEARKIAQKYDIEFEIESLPPDKLNERLKDFKYGLLFRDNISVNNVATPTKINNYMACGLIPVFSDVIDDYKVVGMENPYMITFNSEDDFIRKVMDFERNIIDESKIKNAFCFTFSTYWNIDKYKTDLQKILGCLLN